MTQRRTGPALFVLGLVIVILMISRHEVASDSPRPVIVTNFPKLQNIEGSVSVSEPVPASKLLRFHVKTVPPVEPTDTTRLIDMGLIDTSGFTGIVLSLHGQLTGQSKPSGEVGVLLLPEEESVRTVFDEAGQMHFAIEAASTSAKGAYFASRPTAHTLGFPSYRMYLYNASATTATVFVFAYLVN